MSWKGEYALLTILPSHMEVSYCTSTLVCLQAWQIFCFLFPECITFLMCTIMPMFLYHVVNAWQWNFVLFSTETIRRYTNAPFMRDHQNGSQSHSPTQLELTQFPRTAKSHRQYHEPRIEPTQGFMAQSAQGFSKMGWWWWWLS